MEDLLHDLCMRAFEASGLTQKAVAERTDISKSMVSHLVAGRRGFTPRTAEQWLEACGYTLGIAPRSSGLPAGPEVQALVAATAECTTPHVELLTRQARILPRLPRPVVRAMEAEISEWEQELGLT